MSIPGAGNPLLLGAAGGYKIERSLRFNSADSAYLSRTPASASNRKTLTWSGWVKRASGSDATIIFGVLTAATHFNRLYWYFDKLYCDFYNPALAFSLSTVALFRDYAAWYHIVLTVDTTQATAANRVQIYINGLQQTLTGTYPTQNTDTLFNSTEPHFIGTDSAGSYSNKYLADAHFIDGQALTPSSFGETDINGIWQPKAFSGGSYGTNGFQLKFADNSAATATTLGKDTSGNGNNFTPNNLSVSAGAGNDSLVDSPTNYGTDTGAGGEVRGNYAVFNALLKATNTTLSNGNLDFVAATVSGAYESAISTVGVSSGKWYAEFLVVAQAGSSDSIAGVTTAPYNIVNGWPGGYANSIGYEAVLGNFYKDGVGGQTVNTYGVNDVIGVALDLDNAAIWFSKNGTWQGTGSPNPATNTSPAYSSLTAGTYFFAAGTGGSGKIAANFGQRPFAYTAPSGFKALCTQNLPAPTITKPSTVMDVALWTGNGSARSITGLGFNPDLVWIKGRSGATDHALYDSVRGATLDLVSNSTAAETTQTQGLTAFNSDGFSLGTLAKVNTNAATYTGWTWDAGSSTVTNTSGTISSQVRANVSAGFSVVYTPTGGYFGGSIGHGLNVAPELILMKDLDGTTGWRVYTKTTGDNQYLILSSTAAVASYAGLWNVSSTTFSSNQGISTRSISYCFAPVAGYSAFGSYTGNGSADGPFVYTGFRPRWVMIKNTGYAGQSWWILDTARDDYNVTDNYLQANNANAEGTFTVGDILSNGFKIRTTDFALNRSGDSFIYAAFAEAPFALARAR